MVSVAPGRGSDAARSGSGPNNIDRLMLWLQVFAQTGTPLVLDLFNTFFLVHKRFSRTQVPVRLVQSVFSVLF